MTQLPDPLVPSPGERGLATAHGYELAVSSLAAWDELIRLAESSDLAQPSRVRRLTGAQSLLPFGDWPENRSLAQILDDARQGTIGSIDQGAQARGAQENHADASPAEALDAVRRSRNDLADWIADSGPEREGLELTASLLGSLPVLTLVHATCFQLAVTARDLVPCGAPLNPGSPLLATGLRALVDTTGALAARQGATASITVRTPTGFLGTGAHAGNWRTVDLDMSTQQGPGIIADESTVLDIASGRAQVPALYAAGSVTVTDLPGLLALAPIIEAVPGIPAAASLARAARLMSGIGGALSSLGGLFGRR